MELDKVWKQIKDKSTQENSLIYHKKIAGKKDKDYPISTCVAYINSAVKIHDVYVISTMKCIVQLHRCGVVFLPFSSAIFLY